MSPAIWLIIFPLSAIVIVYLLRRSVIGAIVAAVVAFLCGWFALRVPLGLVVTLLGRPIELDRLGQAMLALLFGAAALLFFVAFVSDSTRRDSVQRGRTFYPVSLASLALFVAAALTRHLGITALLVEGAALLAVFIIQGGRLTTTRASQRFLILMSITMPLFLLAAWRIDAYQLTGGLQTSGALLQTAIFVGIGFSVWLAMAPFHGWLTAIAGEASPVAMAFVFITFPIVAFLTLAHLLTDTAWLLDAAPFATAGVVGGLLTTLIAGVLASVQRSFGKLIGYTALFDIGALVMIFNLGGDAALVTVVIGLAVRALALTLIAASLVALQRSRSDHGFGQLRGIAREMPFAVAGLLIGGLTLAGAPLTIGAVSRWPLFEALTAFDARAPLLLVVGGLGVVIGYLRGLQAVLPDAQSSKQSRPFIETRLQEPLPLAIVIGVLGVTCILLGQFPAPLIEPIEQLLLGVPNPIQ